MRRYLRNGRKKKYDKKGKYDNESKQGKEK
jgi:hypothetical protein